MNQSFQEFLLMQLSIGKMIKINKFEIQFPKSDFGFKTENWISGFQLTSLFQSLQNDKYLKETSN